jgi:hypothetical protein
MRLVDSICRYTDNPAMFARMRQEAVRLIARVEVRRAEHRTIRIDCRLVVVIDPYAQASSTPPNALLAHW